MSTFDEIKEIVKNLAISQTKTDEQMARTQGEIREFQAKTDEQLR